MEPTEIQKLAETYVQRERFSPFREEIEELLKQKNWKELGERFEFPISFGTGGLRGLIGGGDAYINHLNICRATQGIASYVLKNRQRKGSPRIVIAFDSRKYSKEFALQTALVFAANGIKAFLYPHPRSTPQLSFSVRHLGAMAGVMITASHNPKEYNGYKVYWKDGAQIVPPHDGGIIEEVRKVDSEVVLLEESEAIERELLQYLDEKLDNAFTEMVIRHSLRPDLFREYSEGISVVYTPLHGVGADSVKRVFDKLGMDLHYVEEQREPDGDFPTVKSPNPEETSALKMAIELGKKESADILLATDPDADRLAVGIPNENGDGYSLLTGNQLGALLLDYIGATRQELGKLSPKAIFLNTIVTSSLHAKIAASYGIEHEQVLTGFKYIGEKIREYEGKREFIFGCEESYGYLVEQEARDKDAISAVMMAVELMLYNKSQGRTLLDHLNALYQKFGYFEESQINKTFRGNDGRIKIAKIMETLNETPEEIFEEKSIRCFTDYQKRKRTHYTPRKEESFDNLPEASVLQFDFTDATKKEDDPSGGASVIVRPSGTEPKIKFYLFTSSQKSDLDEAKRESALQQKEYAEKIHRLLDS